MASRGFSPKDWPYEGGPDFTIKSGQTRKISDAMLNCGNLTIQRNASLVVTPADPAKPKVLLIGCSGDVRIHAGGSIVYRFASQLADRYELAADVPEGTHGIVGPLRCTVVQAGSTGGYGDGGAGGDVDRASGGAGGTKNGPGAEGRTYVSIGPEGTNHPHVDVFKRKEKRLGERGGTGSGGGGGAYYAVIDQLMAAPNDFYGHKLWGGNGGRGGVAGDHGGAVAIVARGSIRITWAGGVNPIDVRGLPGGNANSGGAADCVWSTKHSGIWARGGNGGNGGDGGSGGRIWLYYRSGEPPTVPEDTDQWSRPGRGGRGGDGGNGIVEDSWDAGMTGASGKDGLPGRPQPKGPQDPPVIEVQRW
jgi:hypothetical protein